MLSARLPAPAPCITDSLTVIDEPIRKNGRVRREGQAELLPELGDSRTRLRLPALVPLQVERPSGNAELVRSPAVGR